MPLLIFKWGRNNMMYLVIGTPQKCIDWVAGTNNDADFTSYIANRLNLAYTLSKDHNNFSGIAVNDKAFQLRSINLPIIKEDWLCFLVDATGSGAKTINKKYFEGIITNISDTYETWIDGAAISAIDLKIQGFKKEFRRLLVNQSLMINNDTASIVRKIFTNYTDSNIVREGTITSPGRMSSVRFVNRYPDNCLAELADVNDYEATIDSVLESTFAGCEVNFKEPVKEYAPFTLDDALLKKLGYRNTNKNNNNETIFNMVTLPYWTTKQKEPQIEYQNTTTNETELKTTVTLNGIPANIDLTHLVRDDFSDGELATDLWLENDEDNTSPPEDFTIEDGYLLEGRLNDVAGLHLLDASSLSPAYGDIGLITNPEKALFEPQVKAAIRLKEININTLGDAIVCSWLDPTCTDQSELFNQSKIIFGLELKSNGYLYSVENGVSSLVSGKTYTTDAYTIRNSCVSYETHLTAQTATNILAVDDPSKFAVNNVIEVYSIGRDKASTETKVTAVNGSNITITAALGTLKAFTKIKTKPKMRLEINGGSYGDVSGSEWSKIAESVNTIQQEPNVIREVIAAAVFQKSLVATIKEVVVRQYPPVEVICDGEELTCSIPNDSAEKDIQVFIEKYQSHYRLRFPSDTKGLWASGTKLEVRYEEKVKQKIPVSDPTSLKAVAEKRGNPILNTDTPETWLIKGGIESMPEEAPSNVLDQIEAFKLALLILQDKVLGDFKITLNNLNSNAYGIIKPGQWIPLNLSNVSLKEIQIQKVQCAWGGTNEAGQAIWQYVVEAAIEDHVAKILKSFGNKARRIVDDIEDDTAVENQSRHLVETVSNIDTVYYNADTPVNYICDAAGNWTDLRRLILSYG